MKKFSAKKAIPIISVLILISLFSLSSCKKAYTEETFFCMDTFVTVKTSSDNEEIVKKCRQLLTELDSELSRHNEAGTVYKYNNSKSGVEVSDTVKELVLLSETITDDTDGAFTAFSGSLTSLWSVAERYPSEDVLENAVEAAKERAVFEGSHLQKTQEGTMLEFGGIAKGYACDRVIELMKKEGVRSGMVSFSSSIGVFGTNPDGEAWKIAVKDPLDTNSVIGYVRLESGGMSVSGDYERSYEIEGIKYNHIIDPKSGLPISNGIHSVVVVSESCAECDALSTAFFVMGIEEVEQKYFDSKEIKYLFVTGDGIVMNDSMREIFVYE